MRKENCYFNYANGQCSNPMSHEFTQMLCCCTMGKAWGTSCVPCPQADTRK